MGKALKAKSRLPAERLKRLKNPGRFSRVQLGLFTLVFAAIGGYLIYQSFAAGPNVWVSVSGNDSNPCTQALPCASIDRALSIAVPGDVVSVAPGTYGAQTISQNKASPGVTVKCELANSGSSSNSCKVGNLSASGSWYTLQDITIDIGDTAHGQGWIISGNDITFKQVKAHGDFFNGYISPGVKNFTWNGGEWGDKNNLGGKRKCGQGDESYLYMLGDTTITNTALKNIDIWPIQADTTPCNGDPIHLETIRIDGNVDGMLMDGLKFHDGAQDNTATIFFTTFRGMPRNIILQNSYLGNDDNSSVLFGGGSNITIRYNTLTGGITQGENVSGLSIIGNAGWWVPWAACSGTHVKNVWQWSSTFSCGSDKVVVGAQYSTNSLGLGSDGYTVQAGSPLIDAGESSCGIIADINGSVRPNGSACDAGADEYNGSTGGTTPKPGDLNSDGVVNITDLSILLSSWNTTNSTADINKDGTVNILDLSILLSNYGT
jgi:hypothetical protein